jgi:hypothetical protein
VEWRSLEASFFITAAVVAAMGVFLVGLNAQLLPGRREEQVEVSSCITDD